MKTQSGWSFVMEWMDSYIGVFGLEMQGLLKIIY